MGGCANDNSNKSARLYMFKWVGGMIAIPMGLMTVFFLMTFGHGCGEYREPDRIIEKDGRKARVYNDSEWIRQRGSYESMIPKDATDVRIYSDSTFGGSTCYIRCTVSEKDFCLFVEEYGYKFEPCDLEMGSNGRSWNYDKEYDPVFCDYPKVFAGKIQHPHSKGFLGCVAHDREPKKFPFRGSEPHLSFVYDSQCQLLWVCYWT